MNRHILGSLHYFYHDYQDDHASGSVNVRKNRCAFHFGSEMSILGKKAKENV